MVADTNCTESCAVAVEGLMYLAPACFFWLMLGVAAVEWPAIRDIQHSIPHGCEVFHIDGSRHKLH